MSAAELLHGDCLERLRELASDSLDSLVTDPPAGISFMGKGWDGDKGGRDQWIAWMTDVMRECLRVLKPGAHGLVWAIPRTSHWTATALENAGFEVRDVVTHLFGSGFPKSMDISKAIDKAAGAEREKLGVKQWPTQKNGRSGLSSKSMQVGTCAGTQVENFHTAPSTDAAKQWQGWGTALKPASEHWILVRKPCSERTVAANVLRYGTGGINIDACRVGTEVRHNGPASTARVQTMGRPEHSGSGWNEDHPGSTVQGRFPANLILDEEAAAMLDEQSGTFHTHAGKGNYGDRPESNAYGKGWKRPVDQKADSGGASRFFYVAKSCKSDRNRGAK